MKTALMAMVLSLTFAAAAQGPMRQGSIEPVVRAALNPKLAQKLGITEEQSAKLKALQDSKGTNKELTVKISAGLKRQAELLEAEKIDETAVMATVDEIWDLRKEQAKNQLKRVIAVKSILTADQVRAATEAMKAMRGQRRVPGGEGKAKKHGKAQTTETKAE